MPPKQQFKTLHEIVCFALNMFDLFYIYSFLQYQVCDDVAFWSF